MVPTLFFKDCVGLVVLMFIQTPWFTVECILNHSARYNRKEWVVKNWQLIIIFWLLGKNPVRRRPPCARSILWRPRHFCGLTASCRFNYRVGTGQKSGAYWKIPSPPPQSVIGGGNYERRKEKGGKCKRKIKKNERNETIGSKRVK